MRWKWEFVELWLLRYILYFKNIKARTDEGRPVVLGHSYSDQRSEVTPSPALLRRHLPANSYSDGVCPRLLKD